MENLDVWHWVAIDPAKPKAKKGFQARTYVEARAAAATFFRIPETVVRVRVVYEYELRAKQEAA